MLNNYSNDATEPETALIAPSQNVPFAAEFIVDNPLIPMDNNPAEQALRMPVAGRRSFYGSGSIWSAEFAVLMMGWIKTLQM